MASRYSYDDFQKAVASSGLSGQFSDADLKLAQQNPDAGMSILQYKQDYQNAKTNEARALANLGAEQIRSSYGGYTGGQAGSQFYLDPLSPKDYQASQAPTYQNSYANTISGLLDKQLGYGSYSYAQAQPVYNNRYDAQIQDLLNQVVNQEDFSYNQETDQLYSQYRKQYAREGQRATQDALGAAAAASGGIPSSYAVSAATQAGDYYASQMTDKIPELYQLAYNKYLNEYNRKLNNLSAVQGAEQSDYDKYLNELQQYNTDRSFDYNAWQDEYNRINNDLQTASGLEQIDYSKYLDQLNQYNTDRNFNYSQLLDEVNNQTARRSEEMSKAQLAAEYGDNSFLQKLGIKPDAAGLESFNNTVNGKTGATGNTTGGNPTGTPTPTPTPTLTALSDADIQKLTGHYGGTQLTDAQWNEILANNPSLTDAVLSDAGFTKKGEEEEEVAVPKGTIDGKTIEEYDAAAGNYASVKAACDAMMAAGEPTSKILQAIKDAWNSGVLNTNDYMSLYNRYRG